MTSKSNPDESDAKASAKNSGGSVQIPHTEEGREFIRLLHKFCDTKALPFKKVARSAKAEPALTLSAGDGSSEKVGSTAYTLDMRIEQEGWPP